MSKTPAGTANSSAWLTLAVASGGQFLSVISTTIVSVALPTIVHDLNATATDLQWIVDAYVLVFASLLATGGVLGDRRGRKGVFMFGIGVFALGSLIAGLAPTVDIILVGRVVQALGPAMLVPGSLNIVRATFHDDRQRAFALGLWSTSSGLAMAVGPIVGGVIVSSIGWRWVFLLNVPLSVVLILISARFVPRLKRTRHYGSFDWTGAILTTIGVAALAFAIIEGRDRGWTSAPILSAFMISLLTLSAFVVVERRLAEPLIDVNLFLRHRFAAANIAGLVVFFAFTGAIVYFSAYFQQVQGYSPVEAGIDVSAIGIAFAVASTLSGHLVGRFGAQWPLILGILVCGTAVIGLLRLQPDTSIGAIWWNFAIFGFGIGLSLAPMASIAIEAVDASRTGMASAVLNSVRQIGQVLGVAVLGALVYAGLPARSGGIKRLDPKGQALFVDGLHNALWVSAVALFVGAALTAFLFWRESRQETTSNALAKNDDHPN